MTDLATLMVILAAGQGTRMQSGRPKVLHEIAGRSMLGHAMAAGSDFARNACNGGDLQMAVVIAPDMDDVAAEARQHDAECGVYVQQTPRGTCDAVLAARQAISAHRGHVMVLFGDTPLLLPGTLQRMTDELSSGADIVVLGFEAANPDGYGRLLIGPDGRLQAIREHKDASPEERAVRLCNSGVMAFRSDGLVDLLGQVGNANASGDFYLTDTIEIAVRRGLKATVVSCDEEEVLGVNSRAQLADAEAIFQRRARARAMAEGATLRAPDSVTFSFDTQLGRDVVIEPNVYFGPGVSLADNVLIKAFSHLEQAQVSSGAVVGPYARLRPGTQLGENVRVGNFVEIKQAVIEEGAKVNHLSYVGNAHVGEGANIGAGTITCNFDGFAKHHTEIGAQAFIGSNSSLVAPVRIGVGAYVGSGSVVSRDVEADALALTRAQQVDRPGWAARFRAIMQRGGRKAG